MTTHPTVPLKASGGAAKRKHKVVVHKHKVVHKQKSIKKSSNSSIRRNKLWNDIIGEVYENSGEMLKDSEGRYNRNLFFTIMRDYVSEMMVRKSDDKYHHVVTCGYGTSMQKARFNQVKVNQLGKELVRNVLEEINRWTTNTSDFQKQMNCYPSTHLFVDQARNNRKEQIMKHIIEPFLQRQEAREGISTVEDMQRHLLSWRKNVIHP